MPAAVLDFYEPEEIEALARAARRPAPTAGRPVVRDRRRGARVARLGGSPGRRALPRRGLHRDATRRAARAALGGRRPRRPPRDRPPRRQRQHRRARRRAGRHGRCRSPTPRPRRSPGWPTAATTPTANDYVFCSRLGRRLDPSAVRRRYKPPATPRACDRCAFTRCATPPARSWLARPARTSSRHSSGTRG